MAKKISTRKGRYVRPKYRRANYKKRASVSIGGGLKRRYKKSRYVKGKRLRLGKRSVSKGSYLKNRTFAWKSGPLKKYGKLNRYKTTSNFAGRQRMVLRKKLYVQDGVYSSILGSITDSGIDFFYNGKQIPSTYAKTYPSSFLDDPADAIPSNMLKELSKISELSIKPHSLECDMMKTVLQNMNDTPLKCKGTKLSFSGIDNSLYILSLYSPCTPSFANSAGFYELLSATPKGALSLTSYLMTRIPVVLYRPSPQNKQVNAQITCLGAIISPLNGSNDFNTTDIDALRQNIFALVRTAVALSFIKVLESKNEILGNIAFFINGEKQQDGSFACTSLTIDEVAHFRAYDRDIEINRTNALKQVLGIKDGDICSETTFTNDLDLYMVLVQERDQWKFANGFNVNGTPFTHHYTAEKLPQKSASIVSNALGAFALLSKDQQQTLCSFLGYNLAYFAQNKYNGAQTDPRYTLFQYMVSSLNDYSELVGFLEKLTQTGCLRLKKVKTNRSIYYKSKDLPNAHFVMTTKGVICKMSTYFSKDYSNLMVLTKNAVNNSVLKPMLSDNTIGLIQKLEPSLNLNIR